MFCYKKVPVPESVYITSDPRSPIRPVGSNVTLICTVELSPAVDVPVSVNTVWTGPDGFKRNIAAEPVMGSNTTHASTTMIRSFGRTESGNYTCDVTAYITSQCHPSSCNASSTTKRISVGN